MQRLQHCLKYVPDDRYMASYLLFAVKSIIEGLRARRAYIAFLAGFAGPFLQDQANFWQTDLF